MNIEELITVIVNDYFWGTPMVIFILLAGAYLTVRTGFFQIRGFKMSMKRAWNNFFGKNKDDGNAGVLSPLEAMAGSGNYHRRRKHRRCGFGGRHREDREPYSGCGFRDCSEWLSRARR